MGTTSLDHSKFPLTLPFSRTQVNDLQDELNAIQSQAHLLMLEQEKELSTVSSVISEAWERVVDMVNTYKKQDDDDDDHDQVIIIRG